MDPLYVILTVGAVSLGGLFVLQHVRRIDATDDGAATGGKRQAGGEHVPMHTSHEASGAANCGAGHGDDGGAGCSGGGDGGGGGGDGG